MLPDAAAELAVPRGTGSIAGRGAGASARVGEAAYRAIIGVAFLLVAVAIVGPMFSARLGPVDDHEIPVIASYLAAHGPLETWIHWIGEADGRFRPLYWAWRVAETAAWGENVTGWYADRLILLVVALGAAYLLARRWFSTLVSAAVALLVVAGPQAEAFYRLGPQEGYAVPLALVGLALVSRRRIGLGLGFLSLASLTKEPFVAVLLVGIAWSWRLGARRSVMLAGLVTLGVGLGILRALVANGGEYYSAQGLSIPLEGRYLYPWVVAIALGVGWLLDRHRWLVAGASVFVAIVVVGISNDAQIWSSRSQAFATAVDAIRVDPRPLVVVVDSPWYVEAAEALRVYAPGRPMELVAPASLPGFAEVTGDCLEVDVDGSPTGRCASSLRLP